MGDIKMVLYIHNMVQRYNKDAIYKQLCLPSQNN